MINILQVREMKQKRDGSNLGCKSKSRYVLEVEKQKSSQIVSVLTINVYWYFSWQRGQHGS